VGKTFSVDEQDIEIASWKIAELLYGPPDGSRKRCRLDDRIKRAMIASFDATVKPERRDSLAAFDRLATAIYYSLYENRSGDLRVCLPVLECVGYLRWPSAWGLSLFDLCVCSVSMRWGDMNAANITRDNLRSFFRCVLLEERVDDAEASRAVNRRG